MCHYVPVSKCILKRGMVTYSYCLEKIVIDVRTTPACAQKMSAFISHHSAPNKTLSNTSFYHYIQSRLGGESVSLYLFLFYIHGVILCLWGVWAHLPWQGCEGQRTICRNRVSPSTTWVPGIKFRLPVFMASVFTAVLLTWRLLLSLRRMFSK